MCRNWQCLEYASWLREVEYRVTVPEKFNADVETSAGPISISNLKGEVKAHTSGGSLDFDGVEGQVNGSTSGGGITMDGGKGRAVVRTSGGPIRISEVAGDVDASTSGGGISIERNLGRVRARTSGGGIEIRDATGADQCLYVGRRSECVIDRAAQGGMPSVHFRRQYQRELEQGIFTWIWTPPPAAGDVWTDFPVPGRSDREQRELRAPLNGGGPLLYLHTSGGGITVRHSGLTS